jgi:predicted component of type VI protein secretion system
MAKLVVLSAGMTGRTHELKGDQTTTIGRVEDNTFQIAEPSVSSHHCEVLLRGSDVLVKDLNSTNGTYINGEKITESTLKPGQTLRLGQIELRLDTDAAPGPAGAPAAAAPPVAPGASPVKKKDPTLAMQRGVSLNELEQGPKGGFDSTSKAFSKKTDKVNKIFLILGITFGVIILGLLLYVWMIVKK